MDCTQRSCPLPSSWQIFGTLHLEPHPLLFLLHGNAHLLFTIYMWLTHTPHLGREKERDRLPAVESGSSMEWNRTWRWPPPCPRRHEATGSSTSSAMASDGGCCCPGCALRWRIHYRAQKADIWYRYLTDSPQRQKKKKPWKRPEHHGIMLLKSWQGKFHDDGMAEDRSDELNSRLV